MKKRHMLGKRTSLDNNAIKLLCQHLILYLHFFKKTFTQWYMWICSLISLVYGSSPLIKLRKNTLFKNGFRPKFCFDLNCLSKQLEFMCIEILIFLLLKYKKEANLEHASETQHYQVSDSKHLSAGNSDADIKLNIELVYQFLLSIQGRDVGLFCFKICEVKVMWKLILPTGISSNKTWANRNELMALAMSFYMKAVFETVQCL